MNLSVYKKQVLLVTCLIFLLNITNVFANPYVKNTDEYKSEIPLLKVNSALKTTDFNLDFISFNSKNYSSLKQVKIIRKKKETSFLEGVLKTIKSFIFSKEENNQVVNINKGVSGLVFTGVNTVGKGDNLGYYLSECAGTTCPISYREPTTPPNPLTEFDEGFSAFVGGDFTVTSNGGGEVEGKLAVGGDLKIMKRGYTMGGSGGGSGVVGPLVADTWALNDFSDDNLIVGGDLTGDKNILYWGDAIIGGANTNGVNIWQIGGSTGFFEKEVGKVNIGIDFPAVLSVLETKSTYWASLPSTGTNTNKWGDNKFIGDGISMLQVFNINTDISGWGLSFVDVPTGATVLINISGSGTITWDVSGAVKGVSRENILLNFYEATDIKLKGEVDASVLAPKTTSNLEVIGNVNGRLIVGGNVIHSGGGTEVHNYPFKGILPAATVTEVDLVTTEVVDNTSPKEGDTITYTISVENKGPSDATAVNLIGLLPTELTYVQETVSVGSYDKTTGLWTIGNIANGDKVTLVLTATVNTGANGPLAYVITAPASGNENDPSMLDDAIKKVVTVSAGVSCTDPNKYGDTCDFDGDGIINSVDLDDDNDGILDTVEGFCSDELTGTWTGSGASWSSSAGGVTVTCSSTFISPASLYSSGNDTFNTTNYWLPNVAGGASFIYDVNWDSAPEGPTTDIDLLTDDQGSGTLTFTFSTPVVSPVLHIDKLGGSSNGMSNSLNFTLVTPNITLKRLSGTDDFEVTGTTIQKTPNLVLIDVNSEALPEVNRGTAAGSVRLDGVFTSVTFNWKGVGFEGNGGDLIEFAVETCASTDTDSDGTPDYLDLDSDNDGCSDALEGAQTTLTLASVDGKGILTGAVDANGVPTIVNGGQADVSSTDPAITGGQCDDDGDGVLNKDDKCNGFDDAIDSDTDGVPDGCDLDNDNDGILDSVECGALLPGAVTGIDTNTLTGTFTSSVLSTDFTLTSPSQIELPLGNKIPVEFKSYAGVTEGILAYWDEGNVIPNTFDIKFTLQAPVNGVLNALRIASNAPGSAYGAQNAKKQITLTWPGGTRAVLSDPLNEIVNLTEGAVITSGTILELDSGTNQILNSRWYLDIDLAGVSYPFSLDYHTVSSVLTRYEGFSFLPKGCSDLDGDTLTNNLDLDSDADGCNDVLESGGIDADNDGILDGTGFDADGKVTGGVNGYDGATGNEYKATKLTADFTALTDQTVAEGTATSFTLTSATAETTISYDASNNPVYGTTGNANIGIQYQWYLGDPATGTALTNTGVYSTVTTATLNISDVKGLGGSVYYLKVTHADNVCIESVGSATLSVFDPCKIGAILGTVTANDPDADGINNVCDSDDDNDGISDTDENINNKNPDADADADGIPLYLDDDDTNAAIGDVNNSIEADFDTDNDGIPNHLDLDADNDGIYDVVEAGGTDTNNDGKADHSGADYSDTAGIPDSAFFGLGVIPTNTNTITGNPADFLNIDSDGDGCSDANEAYNNANTDTNSDGTYGGVITSAEVNANGLVTGAAYGAPNANYTIVSYINSICYIDICTEAAGTDTDNDDVNDICDVDIDNDGILNENENCNSPVWGTAPLTWIAKDDSGTIKLAGGIDMSIDITTTATGDLDAFGGTALNLSATGTGTFGTLDDLAVLFDPAANQGASPVKIQIDFTKEMYNLNFKITDIDAGGFGFRMDKITITSDVGNPILTKVSETSSSFTVANNQATAIRYATSDKDNKGTILVQVPDGAKSITIIYEEVGTVSDPGVRGIGILGDLKYCLDTDNDGTPDSNDLDSDNDGCNDVVESGGIDADADGILDGTGFDADGKVTGGVNGYDGATGNEYKATKLTADFTALINQTVTEGTGTSFTLTSAIAETTISYDASNNPVYGTTGNANIGIQYQWYLGDPATGTALTNTGVYSTVTTAILNISDVTGLGGSVYYLKVTHADNVCIESVGSATLTVNNFPVADNDSSTGNVPGADTVVNIIDGDVLGDGTQADPTDVTVALIAPKSGTLNANGTVTVPGEGVWAYNDATGELTFNPDAGFTTDPTDITYTITEIATTLTSAAAIVHVEYTEADPIANDDTNTTPGTPGVDVSIALLPNDKLSDGSQATVSNTSI
ncbi:choice-of-anchor A family protein, partial [Tenacibaculum finnmarkense]|uniref:choice-of-anchor A family protein n=1 Tax=Tenacibaculum finnmarkense TaxID=2781243 RepID=UPI001EFA65A7